MTQEEYAAQNALNNAAYKKEQLHLQKCMEARKEELRGLTRQYQEDKASLEKEMDKIRVAMAEATAKAADRKATLNNEYLASLKEDLEQ